MESNETERTATNVIYKTTAAEVIRDGSRYVTVRLDQGRSVVYDGSSFMVAKMAAVRATQEVA